MNEQTKKASADTNDVIQERTTIRETDGPTPEPEHLVPVDATMVEPQVEAYSSELRGISINPLNSGYMVKVGCQSVAVESTEKLIDMLNKYLTDPADFEKKWYSKNVRNRLDNI
jgi:hypothetical protein